MSNPVPLTILAQSGQTWSPVFVMVVLVVVVLLVMWLAMRWMRRLE